MIRISATSFFPIIIILFGFNYLLFNLGLVAITPWQAILMYWPFILVYYSLQIIANYISRQRRGQLVFKTEILTSSLLLFLGVYLLIPKFGYSLGVLSWNVIWPVILIVLGVGELVSRKNILFDSSAKSHHSLIGDVHRGGDSWFVEDMYIRHSIGEVHLDLTKAVIPNKEVKLDIGGLVGEVVLYLPADLPITAQCHLGIGEITLFDQHQEGFVKSITFETPDYKDAQRKLNIHIQWKIGEVKIRRIG